MRTSQLESLGATMAFQQEICEVLAQSPMFLDFTWKELETLSAYMTGYGAPAGTVLFQEGDPGDVMGLLMSGEIEVKKEDDDGALQVVARIPRGRTFGEMAVIDGEQRSATCTTTTDCIIVALPKAQFERLIASNPSLGVKFLLRLNKLLSQRLRLASGMLVDYLGKAH
jgi:CRP-like cAMP-binding protein